MRTPTGPARSAFLTRHLLALGRTLLGYLGGSADVCLQHLALDSRSLLGRYGASTSCVAHRSNPVASGADPLVGIAHSNSATEFDPGVDGRLSALASNGRTIGSA